MSAVDLPDRSLRSALEFAVAMAALWSREGVVPPPAALRPFLRSAKLEAPALRKVRAALETDHDFRARVGAVAGGGAVDEVGLLWLTRPDGWRDTAGDLLGGGTDGGAVTLADVRREVKRRVAAEEAKQRAEAERADALASLDAAQRATAAVEGDAAALRDELAKLRKQHGELRSTARRAVSGAGEGAERIAALEAEVAALREALAEANEARDRALVDRMHPAGPTIELDRLRALLRQALAVSNGELVGEQRPRREPLQISGRLHGDDVGTAEFLFRVAGIVVLVDGYNVAMAGWPSLQLDQQRERLVSAVDNLVKRWGTRVQIIFDGALVAGANATRPRHLLVEFSPPGVKADDVLNDRVASFDPATPVAVVTSDNELRRRVQRNGANLIASSALLALLRA